MREGFSHRPSSSFIDSQSSMVYDLVLTFGFPIVHRPWSIVRFYRSSMVDSRISVFPSSIVHGPSSGFIDGRSSMVDGRLSVFPSSIVHGPSSGFIAGRSSIVDSRLSVSIVHRLSSRNHRIALPGRARFYRHAFRPTNPQPCGPAERQRKRRRVRRARKNSGRTPRLPARTLFPQLLGLRAIGSASDASEGYCERIAHGQWTVEDRLSAIFENPTVDHG